MPVMIVCGPAELDLARPLAARLREDGGEVRCYLEDDDWELKETGCKIAVGDLTDDMNLEGALYNAHTFVPLLPDPVSVRTAAEAELIAHLARIWSKAAARSNIEQTVLAIPAMGGGGSVGEAFREAEVSFRKAVSPLCTLRTGLLWGPERPLPRVLRGWGDAAPQEGKVSVLSIEDLVSLVAAADDREHLDGTWEFGGADYSVTHLAEIAGDGLSEEPSVGAEECLRAVIEIGNSATGELGIEASSLVD